MGYFSYKRVEVPNGIDNHFRHFGYGMFTICLYNNREPEYVYLRTYDTLKEGLCNLSHPNIPVIEDLNFVDNNNRMWFRMKKYPKLSKQHRNIAAELYSLYFNARDIVHQRYAQSRRRFYNGMNYECCEQLLYMVKCHIHKEISAYYDPLEQLLYSAANYTDDVQFEFNNENLSSDGDNIIFRDVLFSNTIADEIF